MLLIARRQGLWTTGALRFSTAEPAPASIAVLPFRNLSGGDPYFAEGIGEEILGQLAREPQFRVAGRASSSALEDDADVRDVARRLNVDYVLEGSVRRQGDQVRVNADLVRASDGMRLWSDSYDGKLDDIFAIQQRIGGAIAGALRRRLMRTPRCRERSVTNGEAYNLYLTARGLIRTRNKDVFVTASNLLRDAIKLDPNYAPAWASLAEVDLSEDYPDGSEGLIARVAEGRWLCAPCAQAGARPGRWPPVLGLLLPYGSARSAVALPACCRAGSEQRRDLARSWLGARRGGRVRRGDGGLRARRELDPCGSGPRGSWRSGSLKRATRPRGGNRR